MSEGILESVGNWAHENILEPVYDVIPEGAERAIFDFGACREEADREITYAMNGAINSVFRDAKERLQTDFKYLANNFENAAQKFNDEAMVGGLAMKAFRWAESVDSRWGEILDKPASEISGKDRTKGLLAVAVMPFNLSGCSTEGESQEGPCTWFDCGGHGTCYENSTNYYCACDDGYEFVSGSCVPVSEIPDKDVKDIEVVTYDVKNEEVEREEDVKYEPDWNLSDPVGRCKALGESNCISYSTALFCYPFGDSGYSYKTVDCPDEQHCEDGKCVTNPDIIDENCGPGWKAQCEVTDEYDFVEDKDGDIDHKFSSITSIPKWANYTCGEDDAVELCGIRRCTTQTEYEPSYKNICTCLDVPVGNSFAALDMHINPVPQANYYKIDLKHDAYTEPTLPSSYNCDPYFEERLSITFGDDQKVFIEGTELGVTCIYQGLATFTTAGINDDVVRIQFQNEGYNICLFGNNYRYNVIALAKVRIWSCKCVEN